MRRLPKAEPGLVRSIVAFAKEELWRQGELRWKLHSDQLSVYDQIFSTQASRFVMEIARRWGKTWLLATIAIETCLKNPGCRVVYGAPTLKHLEEFIIPTFDDLIEDAPPDCRPVFDEATGHWDFPNGSHVHLFGADNKAAANRGRGPSAKAAIFDECGFTSVLKYVLKSIFRPQLLTTGGRMYLGSTPAEEPEHDFTEIAERAEANGNYARRTIYDNPLLTEQQISTFIEDDAKEDGLSVEDYKETDTFRREYLAQRVINQLLVVVPEWEKKREGLIKVVPRPEFFDATTILDFGGADPHAASFAYWHFPIAKWVVEDELLLRKGENTHELSEAIKGKERELWGVTKWEGTLRGAKNNPSAHLLECLPDWMAEVLTKDAGEQPHERWADNNLALVRDLYELHKLAFIPTRKDDKELQVNNLRVMIRADQLYLHPRCIHTDRHLRGTTWANHKRLTYARRAGEHGDLLDTLTYGARNLNKRDPFPPHWRDAPGTVPSRKDRADPGSEIARAFLGGTPLGRKLLKGKK